MNFFDYHQYEISQKKKEENKNNNNIIKLV